MKKLEGFQLSPQQRRLWSLQQDGSIYRVQCAIGLRGPLETSFLKKGLRQVVRRHEIFCTTFRCLPGRPPMQVIADSDLSSYREVSLEGLALAEQTAQVEKMFQTEKALPFDLEQGPLLRSCLMKLSPLEHVLFISLSALCGDSWTLKLLTQELCQAYGAFLGEEAIVEEPVQYADFSAWQHTLLEEQGDRIGREFWGKHDLSGLVHCKMPFQSQALTKTIFMPETCIWESDPELAAKIETLALEYETCPAAFLLACWQILLWRLTGCPDITVGHVLDGRKYKDLHRSMGLFAKVLPVSCHLVEKQSFLEILTHVDESLGDLNDWQEYLILADQAGEPFYFPIGFEFEAQPAPYEAGGVSFSIDKQYSCVDRFQLKLSCRRVGDALTAEFAYDHDLFQADNIQRLANQFETLLKSVTRNPKTLISRLEILSDAQRHQLLVEWNNTLVDYPPGMCIYQLFEAQVERTPDSTAVVCEDQHLSYAKLNSRANQLAYYLRRKGVGPGSVTAVMEERSPEMIITLLGILKAGGAYLPIDIQNPSDRVLALLNESKTGIFLTRDHIIKNIPFTRLQNLNISQDVVVTSARPQIRDLDSLPFPDRSLVDYRKYHQFIGEGCAAKNISIMATRGCPYQCLYCHKIWPKTHVMRSAQNIFQEVQLYYDKGYKAFSFLDDIFNLDRRNSEAFFELVIKHNLKVRLLFPNGLRGDLLSPGYIDLMADAGVIQMALALETASPRLQRLIRKNLNLEKLEENLSYICKKHPHIILDLFTMLGFPTETEAEALMTLDFIKRIHWLHFPLLHTLKIYPNTGMARLAMKYGIAPETIERSSSMAYHEPGDTLPFPKSFVRKYQAAFMNEYFLLPERLEQVIPIQKQVLTRQELVARYEAYLPGGIESYPEIARLIGDDGFSDKPLDKDDDLQLSSFLSGEQTGGSQPTLENRLRVLLLDLSQHFSHEPDQLNNLVEAPLGLMCLLTYLNEKLGSRVQGKILKSFIDFDNFDELKKLVDDFRPQVIGIRTLSLHKNFFHKTVALLRQWCPDASIVTGGPYATSEYASLLADRNVDVVVLGEGEVTFSELVEKILEHDGRLPGHDVLRQIAGLAFMPESESGPSRQVLILDRIKSEIAREEARDPERVNRSTDLAYVIYTSGSTGSPKGVMVSHANVARLMRATQGWYHFDEQDVWTLFHSYAFDFSVWELWGALLYGGRLVVVPYWASRSPETFYALLVNERVTVLNQTPSAFRQLMHVEETPGTPVALALRWVIFGGEALELQSLHAWFERHGDSQPRLVNMYGITETTVHVTYRALEQADLDRALGSMIGRPLLDWQTYVLDKQLELAPLGVPGELYVGGAGLARGYRNRPDLTAEKFIPHPFSAEPGARLYRTGDLARYWPDGGLEYLGRIDHQVKLRGFRIELGEIETVLGQHPAVQQAVVLPRKDRSGDQQLIAYVVESKERSLLVSELRRFLQEQLPDYMVPAVFVTLATLPLTPNGKVDRRALSSSSSILEPDRSGLDVPFAVARTPVEEMLASIWADILHHEQVGVEDNFFDLGGHSLLGAQVISRIRQAFQIELPLQRLFETPTVTGLAASIEAARRAGQGLQRPPLAPVGREDALLLSFAQQRLWFLDRLEPHNPFYTIPLVVHLTGQLDGTALERSINKIIQRHQALRMTVAVMDGYPIQMIAPTATLKILVVDLEQWSKGQREAQAQRLATELAHRPFDLSKDLLLRVTLLRMGDTEHVLVVTLHHIVSDAWSIEVFVRELAALYTQHVSGIAIPLPELPIQYADFAHWQRQWLTAEGVLETQLAYWRKQFDGASPVLALPTSRSRPPVQTFRGATWPFTLSQTLFQALQAQSRREDVTLFMMLLAAFQTLLYRYTGQTDIIVGSPIANRSWREIEDLIGLFINTLALRCDLSGNPSFRELLQQVRQVTLGAFTHQDLPFEKLVEELHLERDLSRNPLFQVMFTLQNVQNTSLSSLDLPGLTITPLRIDTLTTHFDLTLSMMETDTELTGTLLYNTDLFDADTMARMAVHLHTLLESIVADPTQRLSDLPVLTEPERRQLLFGWNDTGAHYPQDQCVHELFQAQVQETPDTVAVVFAEECLTFLELDRRADQLAHHLRSLGVGPEVCVGICVERSIEMLVGLLGAFKAGGAYVPLDPAYPRQRLTFMLQDTQVSILLTLQRLVAILPEHKAHIVCLDTDWDMIANTPLATRPCVPTADCLAYVIYTSGSTGEPKGVQISHCAVVNFLDTMCQQPGITQEDIFLSVTALSFDIAFLELFLPLMVGARTVLANQAIAADGSRLAQMMSEAKATIVQATPATWRLLLMSGWRGDGQLKMLCGGEALPVRLADQLCQCGASLWNMYGPTETTIWSALYPVGGDATALVPIGKPIANTQIYILDRHLHPVPIGVIGELHIGGDGLGRGYWQRPALTAEKFIPDLLSGELGGRLYRTGDLGRYQPDGNLEYLGRLDYQVKIRGFRIELGEVEATLSRHPAVREVVVLARNVEPAQGDKHLVAYIVSKQMPAPTSQDFRSFMREWLPDYMLPSAFVVLDALPLTPNGKIDRNALPDPQDFRPSASSALVAPRSKLERMIAAIWQEVLQKDQIGIHDNFFDLGGHSLALARVHGKLSAVLDTELSVAQLFEYPTINSLAQYLSRGESESLAFRQTDDWIEQLQEGKARVRQQLQQRQRALSNDECV